MEALCDFQDVALYALTYLKTHSVDRYAHIIIDESQDLSKVQLGFQGEIGTTLCSSQ